MSDPRLAAAAAIRRLGHALVAHEVDEARLGELAVEAGRLAALLEAGPSRRRPLVEPGANLFAEPAPEGGLRSHFPDCIVTGEANPMGVAATARREGDEGVLVATLGPAFEGAPGRAHGGLVAALLDEVMGFMLGVVGTPAYTGRLTVHYRAPVPMGVPLEFRSRLTGREGRKLFIEAEGRHEDLLVAEAEALFVTVAPEHFTAARHQPAGAASEAGSG